MSSGIRIPLVSDWNPKGINQAKRDFKKLETTSQKFAFGMKKAFLPATAGLVALSGAASKFISAGEAAATSNARIRQVADSMGLFGAASSDVTKKLIEQAEATARLTGVDQNQIKQAQASLLTFGEIAKSADEMGGAFDRATQLTVDLAAAGFGSVETNAIQLGKALNDPIKGLSALSKSGVTFTEQEKELITTLVESGKQFEAQDMILKAIEKQVGGTGAATANATDKLKVGFSQMAESIGLALLPLVETVIPVMIGLFEFMGDHTGVVIGLGIALGTLAGAVVAINVAMKTYYAFQKIVTAAQWLWNAALTANPIGLIIVGIAALIAIVVLLLKKFGLLTPAIDAIKVAFDVAWSGIRWVINKIIDGINSVIGLLNKIPGVEIPQLGHLGDEAKEVAKKVDVLANQSLRALEQKSKQAERALEPLIYSIKGVRREGDEWESTLGRVNVETDKLNEGVQTATRRLDDFFNELDQRQAAEEFIDDLGEIAEKLNGMTEGSKAWQEAQDEAYEALRTLRQEREDLDDSFFEVLKLEIDTGDLDRAIELMQLVDEYLKNGFAPGFQGLQIPVTFGDLGMSGSFMGNSGLGASDGLIGGTVINNYYPPGVSEQDVAAAMDGFVRSRGSIPATVTGNTTRR